MPRKAQLVRDVWIHDTEAPGPWIYRIKANVIGRDSAEVGETWYAPNAASMIVRTVGKDGEGRTEFTADVDLDPERYDLFAGTSPAGSPFDGLHRPIVLSTMRPLVPWLAGELGGMKRRATDQGKAAKDRFSEGRVSSGSGYALLIALGLYLLSE